MTVQGGHCNFIACISLAFLHCEFSNVSSNCLPERMQSPIDCICMTFLHKIVFCVFSALGSERVSLHWLHLFYFSPLCFSNVFSGLSEMMQRHTACICLTFTVRLHDLRTYLRTYMSIISGEKWNKCNQCYFASSRAGHLKRHMITHTG